MNTDMTTGFPVTQKELKRLSGFSYQELNRKRADLVKGMDWKLVDGERPSEHIVCWSQAAADAVLAEARGPALTGETGGALAGTEAPGARSQEPETEKGAEPPAAPEPRPVAPEAEKPAVAAPSEPAEALPAVTAEKAAAAAGMVLTVARGPHTNPHILDGFGEGGSAKDARTWVRVKVRSSAHFLPGMRLRAEKVAGALLWKFLGPPEGEHGYPGLNYPPKRGSWGPRPKGEGKR